MARGIRKTAAGYQVVGSAVHKLGFHGATPTVQRSGGDGVALGAPTYAAPNAGDVDSGDATTDAVIESLRDQLIALAADVANHRKLVNELRATLVEKGLHKGAA